MKDPNPYSSPSAEAKAAEIVDDKYVVILAKSFQEYRRRGPSFVRLCLRWPGIPFLTVMALVCSFFAIMLGWAWEEPDVFDPLLLLLFFFAGAITREVGYYLKFVRLWPAYQTLLDWRKIDELEK